jgi:hypothetical protein
MSARFKKIVNAWEATGDSDAFDLALASDTPGDEVAKSFVVVLVSDKNDPFNGAVEIHASIDGVVWFGAVGAVDIEWDDLNAAWRQGRRYADTGVSTTYGAIDSRILPTNELGYAVPCLGPARFVRVSVVSYTDGKLDAYVYASW